MQCLPVSFTTSFRMSIALAAVAVLGCAQQSGEAPQTPDGGRNEEPVLNTHVSAEDLLGSSETQAFCYGGFREATRDRVPTVDQIKEDMAILAAMGVRMVRTYNTQQFAHASNLLEAIRQLREERPGFEMYVMLGAWIECANAWTPEADHERENESGNAAEIAAAVQLAKDHPESVKVIAVGNEAMVHWATNYFVRPAVILRWVKHLQSLKDSGELPNDLWITSSDNFAAWGGGTGEYHTPDLDALIKAVDYISVHTYPFHHTHYDPENWGVPDAEENLDSKARIKAAIGRAVALARKQYLETKAYIDASGIRREIHIGETGWATEDHAAYGSNGSRAADEYKASLFYDGIREWTRQDGITCFYFEAFDENWKDPDNDAGSENHFGVFTIDGQAKFVLWDEVDAGLFNNLGRNNRVVSRTLNGNAESLFTKVRPIPLLRDSDRKKIFTINETRTAGDPVGEDRLIVVHQSMTPANETSASYPSGIVKVNVWEGTCQMVLTGEEIVQITSGTGPWWGCALELARFGENLTEFTSGHLHFEIKGDLSTPFELGVQSGNFGAGTQVNAKVTFNIKDGISLTDQWVAHRIPMSDLTKSIDGSRPLDLSNITSLLFVRGTDGVSSQPIALRNIYFSRD